jgi:DNA-binding XRE family transcriptional regulator
VPLPISAAQCRAARALLDWNQDKLAESAHVGRATIADFERGIRLELMRQNMISIVSTLEAAGVEFLPETQDGAGAGVRLRKVELQFSKEGRMLDGGILFALKFKGASHQLFVPREVLDDLGQLVGGKDGDRVRVASEYLGLIMRAAELKLARLPVQSADRVVLGANDFPPGTF